MDRQGINVIKVYLIDIDGTVANIAHRLHHINGESVDWPAFFAACDGDAPIPHMVDLVNQLARDTDVLFVSGRSDEVRGKTVDWLRLQFGTWIFDEDVYMRKAGDHRPDNVVKSELLDVILAEGWQPVMAFDDRDQVVKMWRERGIPCAQVAPGNF